MGAKKKARYSISRNYEPVGRYLQKARHAAGLSQREVSDALGYSSAQFISNFECGIAVPPLKKLKMMIDLYKMDVHKTLDLILETEREVMLLAIQKRRA